MDIMKFLGSIFGGGAGAAGKVARSAGTGAGIGAMGKAQHSPVGEQLARGIAQQPIPQVQPQVDKNDMLMQLLLPLLQPRSLNQKFGELFPQQQPGLQVQPNGGRQMAPTDDSSIIDPQGFSAGIAQKPWTHLPGNQLQGNYDNPQATQFGPHLQQGGTPRSIIQTPRGPVNGFWEDANGADILSQLQMIDNVFRNLR